jgi:hypothetical protein
MPSNQVSGLTMASAERQSRQIRHRTTHKNRSTGFKRGRFFAIAARHESGVAVRRSPVPRPREIETRIAQQRAKAESGASRRHYGEATNSHHLKQIGVYDRHT